MKKEQAISVIRDYLISKVDTEDEHTAFGMAIKALEQPERKKAKWTPEFNGAFKGGAYWFSCSECGRIVPEVRNGGWNFCPNCGADMRGGEE